ncbi:MAG: mRNA interferase MazF [Pelotomaculum sp. PtaU1.Bin035]|nr:MAG: mRNA interferase MazF [Pelotomaculum sp. PtaU1.Bin035]
MVNYTPDRGDVIWLQFDPQAGYEQAGRRPALVISPISYNSKLGLALLCPVTSKVKGYPFEVLLPVGSKVSGAVLSDQIKSLDWQAREAKFACKATEEVTMEVLSKIQVLIS